MRIVLLTLAVLCTNAYAEKSAKHEPPSEAMIRRFYDEAWNQGQMGFIDELFSVDCVRHDPAGKNPPGTAPEVQKAVASAFRKTFPDTRMVIDVVIAEGDQVMARWTISGTDKGGWMGAAPTGKRVSFSGVNIFRFSGAKVVEIWNHRDDLSLLVQLGVVTLPAASAAAPAGRISVSDKQAFDESTLTPDVVLAKIMAAYMAGLRRCYKEYLAKDAKTAGARGKLSLDFGVDANGRLVHGHASGVADEIDTCVGDQMASWRFPIPKYKGGDAAEATFKITLQLVPE